MSSRAQPGERARPLKRLGQHFLASGAIARRIVDASGAGAGDAVLEIGPGRGVLTELLADRAGKLVAVELDRRLAAELASRYLGRDNVRIIQADFLELDLGLTDLPKAGALVVANLPYNAAVPILEKLLAPPAAGLAAPPAFASLVVMVQREVAQRMTAGPGTKVYGSLSVFIQSQASVERLFDVSPGSFYPPPKVVSSVVRIRPLPKPLVPAAERDGFHAFVRACFGYRRKMLKAGLRQVMKRRGAFLPETVALGGIDLSRRAENLSIGEFLNLYRELDKSARS